MSDTLNEPFAEGRQIVLCPFSFAPNGGASPVASTIIHGGCVQSITWISTGLLTVKFNSRYATFIGPLAGLQLNAFGDTQVQFSGFTPYASAASPASIQIRIETAGVLADIAANANNRITCLLLFSYAEKII